MAGIHKCVQVDGVCMPIDGRMFMNLHARLPLAVPDYSQHSDEQLFELWREGDRQAAGALFDRHHASIARFFSFRLGPDTSDLIQRTFLALIEGAERYRGDVGFRGYLFGIARNVLLRELRERSYKRARFEFDPSTTSIAALDPSPSSVLAVKLRYRLLLTALRELPVDVQIMLELHYWEKMKIDDIALSLDMNKNTVRTKMRRGREKLEAHMQRLRESGPEIVARDSVYDLGEWAASVREGSQSQG